MSTFNLEDTYQVDNEYFHWADLTSSSFTHNVGKLNVDTYEITCWLYFNKADRIDAENEIIFLNELLKEFSLKTVSCSDFKQNFLGAGDS